VRHLPNLICLFRIALVWPVLRSIWTGHFTLALILFIVAAVSDVLDGYLAKHYGWQSALGKFLDPLADKLLLVSAFVEVTWLGLAPWWLTAAAVARDVLIGLGAVVFKFWFGPLRGKPTIISKLNTAIQLLFLMGVMLHAATEWFPPQVLLNLGAIVAFGSTLISGFDYMRTFTRRAWSQPATTL
jgi:cardiolipin synthase